MYNKNDFILKPGMRVDLVFNLNSLSPNSRPTIIFDVDETSRQIIIDQPTQKIGKGTLNQELHISTLINKDQSSKIRVGYACSFMNIIKSYQLSGTDIADAISLECRLPLLEINLRAAYRFHPNSAYEVTGELVYKNEIYYSGQYFIIYNISITGIGLLIPKTVSGKRNPLTDIARNSLAKITIFLKNTAKDYVETIDTDITVVRTDMEFNKTSGFAGCIMRSLTPAFELVLNKFIHKAQIDEIQRFNPLR